MKNFIQYITSLWLILYFAMNVCLCQPNKPAIVIVDPNVSIQKWVGKKLPIFNLQDLKGNSYDNKSISGKIIVINLWSTTCHPCIEEMPLLNKLVDKYADRNVIFLAPAPEVSDKINHIIDHQPFKYTVLPQAQDLFRSLALPGYPYHIIVDRDGFIRFIRTGTMNQNTGKKIAEDELPESIERVLK